MEEYTFGNVTANWLGHASIKLKDSNRFVIYIDPWTDIMDDREYEKADLIISTHDHFDHFDPEAINRLKQDDTVLVCTEESEEEVPGDIEYEVIRPGETVEAKGHEIHGVHAYNVDKFREEDEPFHPKGFSVGVLFEIDDTMLYHASDTDPIDEMGELPEDIDAAFLPVGGHFTMDQEEAIEAINKFDPENVVPIHFGHIEETTADIERFKEDVENETETEPVVLEPID